MSTQATAVIGRPRRWRRLRLGALIVLGLLIASSIAHVDLNGSGPDHATIEESVRSNYEQQLGDEAAREHIAGPVDVVSVDCVDHRDGDAATCFAQVDGGLRGKAVLDLTYGKDGRFIWQTQSENLKPPPTP